MEEQGRWQVSYKIACTVENAVSIEFTLAQIKCKLGATLNLSIIIYF